jgi:hypothetical protein
MKLREGAFPIPTSSFWPANLSVHLFEVSSDQCSENECYAWMVAYPDRTPFLAGSCQGAGHTPGAASSSESLRKAGISAPTEGLGYRRCFTSSSYWFQTAMMPVLRAQAQSMRHKGEQSQLTAAVLNATVSIGKLAQPLRRRAQVCPIR